MLDSDEEIPDDESIHYIGPIVNEPQVLDFELPLWLIEIEYSSKATQHIVNARNEREARDLALLKAESEGELILSAEAIRVGAVEKIEGGSDS